MSKNTKQGTEAEPNRNSPAPFTCQTPGDRGGSPLQVIYLSKLKSGERLTPPKANVCGERCARAVRACGVRVRCAIYARSDACSARYTRAMIVLTPCWNIYAVYTSALGLLKPQHSISMVSFTVSQINWNGWGSGCKISMEVGHSKLSMSTDGYGFWTCVWSVCALQSVCKYENVVSINKKL